jgi:hypothetical protein
VKAFGAKPKRGTALVEAFGAKPKRGTALVEAFGAKPQTPNETDDTRPNR